MKFQYIFIDISVLNGQLWGIKANPVFGFIPSFTLFPAPIAFYLAAASWNGISPDHTCLHQALGSGSWVGNTLRKDCLMGNVEVQVEC